MKTKLLAMMPYVIVLMINFYALPLLITNTGLAMLAMLAVMPLITFICAVIYGARQGFGLLFALVCGVYLRRQFSYSIIRLRGFILWLIRSSQLLATA